MVNLKRLSDNLRREMVSHITLYLPSTAKPSYAHSTLLYLYTNFPREVLRLRNVEVLLVFFR
jgi:hypothetical protein